jgi:hypothetical protein
MGIKYDKARLIGGKMEKFEFTGTKCKQNLEIMYVKIKYKDL